MTSGVQKKIAHDAKEFERKIHPVLIIFPYGLFTTAPIFDILRVITGNATFSRTSYYMIAGGIISGLVAAVTGFIDWRDIPPNTRARAMGLWHGLGNILVVILFAISWRLRSPNPTAPTAAALTFSYAAVILALVTGWLGGELVFRLRVGVRAPPKG
jgi:uncharacterized membrane protein